MGDKELLELAAKAAGIFVTREQYERDCTSPWDKSWEILEYDDEKKSISGWATIYSFDGDLSGWGVTSWSPLTDDGDALRLATRLCMSISTGPCRAAASTISGALRGAFFEEDTCHQDQDEAVRRVIVRCAAEVGKAMP